MELYYCVHGMDFAISLASFDSRSYQLKDTNPCNDHHPLSKSVCELFNNNGREGSGVIVATRQSPVFVNGKPVFALVLTAGHVVGNILLSSPIDDYERIRLVSTGTHSSIQARGFLIKDYSDWKAPHQIDEIMNQEYVVPNDLALIAVTSYLESESEICDYFNKDDTVTVVGFPKRPNIIEYCAPCLKSDTFYERTNKIEKAFCNFDKRVFCEGTILSSSGSDLICANYSATSGMSGAPVFLGERICGVNIGGASLKYQGELGNLIGYCQRGEWGACLKIFDGIMLRMETDADFDCSHLQDDFFFLLKSIERCNFENLVLYAQNLMQKVSIAYVQPLQLDHNVALSCTHDSFREVKKICLTFKSMPDMVFADNMSFYNFVNN